MKKVSYSRCVIQKLDLDHHIMELQAMKKEPELKVVLISQMSSLLIWLKAETVLLWLKLLGYMPTETQNKRQTVSTICFTQI